MIKINIIIDNKTKKHKGGYGWKKPTKKELEAVERVLEEFHKDIKKSKDVHK